MTKVRTSNAGIIEVRADENQPFIRIITRRATTGDGGCQALLNMDQASELAAVIANLVDAAKRGSP